MAGKSIVSAVHPIRKLCAVCGRAMKLDPAHTARERYVCPCCDRDPLHDPVARRWIEGPLKPPA